MRNYLSLLSCILILLVLLVHRIIYPLDSGRALKITDWDALGYYMYLPAIAIYHDVTELKWFDEIDEKYAMSGGALYQANKHDNGNYVFKYLGGVAILQAPFFAAAHIIAKTAGYPPDGFSPPYQHAIAYGAIIYSLLSLLLLRRIMLWYFADNVVALVLLLLCLATNFIQYAAIHNGMSHVFIFPLYALVLYITIKWHEKPSVTRAAIIGYIIGLATICRPTEAVMLLIPLLWGTHTKEAAKGKWQLVKDNHAHVVYAVVFGMLGIMPQIIYWKLVAGSFIYDPGSSWRFLTPFFRVLFGWEKGWFIYTPVTILFIAGLFLLRKYPFKNSVIWFCILNIYIVISWADWRYGGSYSTRALVQSYPVFALPLAAVTERALRQKWRALFFIVSAYLVFLNIFQVWQFNRTIIQGDMTREYYSRIYLDPHPSPLDLSLLDTDEVLRSDQGFKRQHLFAGIQQPVQLPAGDSLAVASVPVLGKAEWLKIESRISYSENSWSGQLIARLVNGDSMKRRSIRLQNPVSRSNMPNDYAFFICVPAWAAGGNFELYLSAGSNFNGMIEKVAITGFVK